MLLKVPMMLQMQLERKNRGDKNMEMTLRWFGTGYDSVSLQQIRQIPGVTGVVTTLYNTQPGQIWTQEDIHKLKEEVESSGLRISAIESVNVHDAIKIGTKDRDYYIDNYIKTLENLGKEDIHIVVYNFMPVFDWTRSDLARMRPDGSTVLAYNQEEVDKINPSNMFKTIKDNSNGFIMPGWEPERLEKLSNLFEAYKDVDDEMLFQNLIYFLKRLQPVCEKYDIKMAIHPDDPAWPVFGLPRIITGKERIMRLLKTIDAPFNCINLCTGSLGSNPKNNIVDIIKCTKGRVPFVHVRNLQYNSEGDFQEAAHLSSDGSMDMFRIVQALYQSGFDGVIRPDHGRMIWGEVGMPGYGLYDRALGAMYLQGLWEAISKEEKR